MSKTVQLPFINILSCLSLIEKSVPCIDNFSLYVPSLDFNPNDVISIQNEAKKMMEFIGLKGYTTIVTPCSTDNGTAGNINLNNSQEVFIEIDGSMQTNRRNFRDAVLCVMAHEICHKYLYSHGLYLEDTKMNEYCTDIATFFVGFGLLTINGCYEQYKTTTTNSDGSTTTTTHTHSTGYLTPQNYLTAHQVVCKIHKLNYLDGVSPHMRTYISQLEQYAINKTELNRDSIIEKFKSQSLSLANRKRELTILKSYLELREKELLSEYEKNDKRFNRLVLYKNSIEKLPYAAMHVLNLPQDSVHCSEYLDILDNIDSKYHPTLDDNLLTIKCPFCGTISCSKLQENGLSIRKCQCGKVFYWDSRSMAIYKEHKGSDEGTDNNKNVPSDKSSSWFKRLFSWIKK